ncbi:MAG: aminotransferase class V-fold PLP-dependent enzyme [Deltaproteobacteria bacterium]|nr:aminotransferase class V-fold PLP-dependent enzyme [Deltaproteobacteria bacterium]
MTAPPPEPDTLRSLWSLDPDVVYLNHGGFGACPRPLLAAQAEHRARIERNPAAFFQRDWLLLQDEVLQALGAFVGAEPEDLALLTNATTGVNTVLASLRLGPGDELLVTDHEYRAVTNAAVAAAERAGARVVVAEVPFPVPDEESVVAAVLARVTERTRLALIDHVTSVSGMRFPVERLVPALQSRGVDVLVDGAHALGMLPLALDRLGAAYYTGNAHKWLCTPKGAAFLHVRRDRQEHLRPLVVSHGATLTGRGRSRFRLEADWTGTTDVTPYLCIPEAIRFFETLLPGGWTELRARNHALVVAGRRVLLDALGLVPGCPEALLGAMAALPLPARRGPGGQAPYFLEPLQEALALRFRIEVPVAGWPGPTGRTLRISAQLYNRLEDYEALAHALRALPPDLSI